MFAVKCLVSRTGNLLSACDLVTFFMSLKLVQKELECVSHPEVILCSCLVVQIQDLFNCEHRR